MLEVGKREYKKDGIDNITFIKGYAEELPFFDASFDIVISRLAFHHFADPAGSFREMTRVLKPDGKLVMIDMTFADEALREETDRIERLRDPSHLRALSLSEMRQLYESNGLSMAMQEQTDIPVSLEAWMNLTNTSEETRKYIRDLMMQDLAGSYHTGFSLINESGDLCFLQHWIFNYSGSSHLFFFKFFPTIFVNLF